VIQKIMLVVEDVTELEELEKEAKENEKRLLIKTKRLQEIVSHSKDKMSEFFEASKKLIEGAKEDINRLDLNGFFRVLHTLKGNARVFGFSDLSGMVHNMENEIDFLREGGSKELGHEELGKRLLYLKEEMIKAVDLYLNLAKEVYGPSVDDSFNSNDDEILELRKADFIGVVNSLKKRAEEKNDQGLIGIIEKLEYPELKKELFVLKQTVSKISSSLNKKIDFNIQGPEVYLNAKIKNLLKDSVIHMIQNSCDHGISEEGAIQIVLEKKEGRLFISISDNGEGMDPDKIMSRALKKGLVTAEELEHLKDEDIFGLIFLPGFSTRDEATEYSGRGVGLDVVKTNIKSLGGNLKVESKQREGTAFQISIPEGVLKKAA